MFVLPVDQISVTAVNKQKPFSAVQDKPSEALKLVTEESTSWKCVESEHGFSDMSYPENVLKKMPGVMLASIQFFTGGGGIPR